MKKTSVLMITQAAIIAALYVVLTWFSTAIGLSSGVIQVRFSEALSILPLFTPAAIPGLYVGCIISNMMVPGVIIWDVIFGSLATLLGAIGAYLLRRHKFLMTLPPVIANTIIVPFVLKYGYGYSWEFGGQDFSLAYFATTVGIGEIISVCVLGSLLLKVLLPYKNIIFKNEV